MVLWKRLKSFLLKENYDFNRPDMNLYNFHPQISILYALNGVFCKNKNSLIRLLMPCANTALVLVAIGIEIMLVHRGLTTDDLPFAAESYCYIMILGTTPTCYLSTIYNGELIIEQLEEMNNDFIFLRNMAPKFRDCFIKGQLKIWTLGYTWLIFCSTASAVYASTSLVALFFQTLFGAQDEHKVRPLIFPLWLPYDDPYRTPNYEVFLFLEIMLIIIVNQSFGAYVYSQLHLMLHYYNLMSLIEIDLKMLLDGLDESVMKLPKDAPPRLEVQRILKKRMQRIIKWHQSVFKAVGMVSSVYGPPLAYQVFFSSMAICIMAYQVADQLDDGKFNVLFAMLCAEAIVQLWIPCYMGTLVSDKSLSMAQACWDCGWETTPLGRLVLLDLTIMMVRSQKTLTIKFTGLPSLTLETYSSILSASYSYFNMLRRSTQS